jgi:hypothetical protein
VRSVTRVAPLPIADVVDEAPASEAAFDEAAFDEAAVGDADVADIDADVDAAGSLFAGVSRRRRARAFA